MSMPPAWSPFLDPVKPHIRVHNVPGNGEPYSWIQFLPLDHAHIIRTHEEVERRREQGIPC